MTRAGAEWVIQDLETGVFLDGIPDDPLASTSRGWAWQRPDEPRLWRLRDRRDPPGVHYRLVQVFGGPAMDPDWYENSVENLDTSEG
ncbi:MAG TPA: hypothetical protein VJ506_03715 [Candidatus Limnocylindrales bacterium]|nr:hypothetical protein [Candidatus Limnocylindrales bacterium]